MTVRAVLYLHGFRSSPRSTKARLTCEAARAAGWFASAPDLNDEPAAAAETARREAESLLERGGELLIVGSSLGGFYAGRLAAELGCRSALLNPCLEPWALIGPLIGWHDIEGTDRRIRVDEHFGPALRALAEEVSPIPSTRAQQRRTWVLLSDADEVLDWTQARDALRGCRQMISPGDDHRIQRYAEFLPSLFAWASAAADDMND